MSDDDQYTKTVKDFVPTSKLAPITNQVTSNDVHTFGQVVSNSLARMSSHYTDEVALKGGYALLVEKKLNYKIRINDPTAKLPVPQKEPVRLTVETSTAMTKYCNEMKSFRIEHNCNLGVRALLDEKFPGILNSLKQRWVHSLVYSQPEMHLIMLKKAVRSTAMSNKKSLDHIRTILDRKYTPE